MPQIPLVAKNTTTDLFPSTNTLIGFPIWTQLFMENVTINLRARVPSPPVTSIYRDLDILQRPTKLLIQLNPGTYSSLQETFRKRI